MRILAGSCRGRWIRTRPTRSYRPTSARVRKSLFDLLGNLTGLTVLDLYSGSGILGLEAASRGALSVTCVERDPQTVKLLRENLRRLGDLKVMVRQANARSYLQRCPRYDLILADPPYGYRKLQLVVERGINKLNNNGRFVLESATGEVPVAGGRSRTYGATQLTIWTRTE